MHNILQNSVFLNAILSRYKKAQFWDDLNRMICVQPEPRPARYLLWIRCFMMIISAWWLRTSCKFLWEEVNRKSLKPVNSWGGLQICSKDSNVAFSWQEEKEALILLSATLFKQSIILSKNVENMLLCFTQNCFLISKLHVGLNIFMRWMILLSYSVLEDQILLC